MLKKTLRGFLLIVLILISAFALFVLYAIRPGVSESELPRFGLRSFAVHPEPNSTPQELHIVTYNIGYASGKKNNQGAILSREEVLQNLEAMAARLKALHPDLLFLQEVDFHARRSFDIDQFQYLAEKLGMPYGAYVVTWNKKYVAWPYWPFSRHFGRVVSGQAILSRYPVLSQQLIEFPKPAENPFWYNWFYLDRIVQHLTIQLGKKEASVYNVHLEAFAARTRQDQLEKLERLVKADPAALKVVAGDFNLASPIKPGTEDSDNDAQGLLNSFAQTTQLRPAEAGPIFFSMPSWDPHKKIDHIFFSPRLILEKTGNLEGLLASDHLPVWADLGQVP